MHSKIPSYNIEIKDRSFEADGRKYVKTAIVKTYVAFELVAIDEYGWVDKNDIYKQILEGQEVNYKHCYIEEFSIREYRKINNLCETYHVIINDFEFDQCFFNNELDIDFNHVIFESSFSLKSSIFSHGGVSFYSSVFRSYKSAVDFRNVLFGKGLIDFQYVEFSENDTDFSGVRFCGGAVSFINTNFHDGHVKFKDVDFGDAKVSFQYAKFGKGGIDFQKAEFDNPSIDFRRVEFGKGRVNFRRTIFHDGDVLFDESEFVNGPVKFNSAQFGRGTVSFEMVDFGSAEVNFDNVDFGTGKLSFYKAKAQKISLKRARLDLFTNFCVQKVNVVDFSEVILRDIIDMKTDAKTVSIETMYIVGMRNLGKLICDWHQNDLKKLICSQKDTSKEEKAEQFTILKENFSTLGKYEQEDLAYIQFKRYEYRAEYQQIFKDKGVSYLKVPGMWFRWLVFDKMGLFATSPLRVFASMLFVYVLFSLSYFVLHQFDHGAIINSVGATDNLSDIKICFYHSAITFLTIGYGDYYPTELSRGLSISEGWVGLFLMSYFTVAFVRKILR